MRFIHALPCAALAAIALVACGEPGPTILTITAAPTKVEVAKGNFTTITVTGTYNDGVGLPEGAEMIFSTDYGSFNAESTEASSSGSIEGGKASLKLYASSRPGKAAVEVSYIDPYLRTTKVSVEVSFTTPTVAKLNFTCTARNIGAFISGEDIKVRCDATPEGDDGKPVTFAAVKFKAEAGEFELGETDAETGKKIWLYNPRAGGREPKNVEPFGGEPSWLDSSASNRKRNPRDGLVTLLAYVEGDDGGIQGDPFVDANDDKEYNAGEEFVDTDGDGEYSEEGQSKYIWKKLKVLWTGELHTGEKSSKVAASAAGNVFDIARGGLLALTWTLLDKNLNVLAANSPDDAISFTANEGTVTPVGLSNLPVKRDSWGIDIDNKFEINSRESAASYTRDCTYSVTIRNDAEEPEPYQFSGLVSRNYAVDESGAPTGNIGSEQTPVAIGSLK